MGFKESLAPYAEGGISVLRDWGWLLWILVGVAAIVFIGWMMKLYRDKNRQWTHKLKVRQVIGDNNLTETATISMRRYPLIKTGEVFELENALLGSYLISELDAYTGRNEYSVIIDKNGRIYTNKGEKFCPDKKSVNVSAKHSEIDIALGDFKRNYQEVHRTNKRVEWGQIAKATMIGLLIIACMVVAIKGIDKWADNHAQDAQRAASEAEAYRNLNEVFETIEDVVNTQVILVEEIKELKGTNNIQTIIRSAKNETVQEIK
jgi:large-conductance mechanosensitive channel